MRFLLALIAVVGFPAAAMAHTGVGAVHGFMPGFMHPIGGIDHVLAMVAVGLLGFQIGGRAVWALPGAFMAMMAAGGGLAMAGIGLPFVETGIALSIVVIAGAAAFAVSLPVAAAAALVGVFAVFHGHAHGAEMPETMFGLTYGLGFVAATGLLHSLGIGAGLVSSRLGDRQGMAVSRVGAGVATLAGLVILSGAM